MQLEVNNGSISVVFDTADINTVVGDAARIEVGEAINYIKTGEAEIASYVNGTAKPAIYAYVTNTAEPNIDSYVANTIYPQFDTYIDLAKDWATKTDGSVDGNEYSAKYYANQAAALFVTLAPVATSGSYNDLTDKPTIPTKTSDLANDSGFVTSSQVPLLNSSNIFTGGVNEFTGNVYVPDVEQISAPSQKAANTKYVHNYVGTANLILYSHGTEIDRFSANAKTDKTIDLNIPTRVSQLTDAASYATQVWVSTSYASKSYVTTSVGTETTNRQNADNNLQSQIDAITASSDVTDIVGTYAQLQAYDTSTLAPNSIIKVLQDESRNTETTYYRWVITVGAGAWSLIGEEGPYYTISAADAKFATQTALTTGLATKQDVISDLATIRSGAALGATAVQPNDLDDYATTQYVDDELSEKQDTLTAGANIQIVGNTISATDTTYTAGNGISIIGNVISNTQTSAEWGNITGTLSAQTDLWNVLNAKANTADIPTATSDLTNDSGFITSSALSGYATQTWVENKGYITSSALTPYVLSSSLATVATSGNYNDLTNKPTIPTVNNATLTIQKNSSDIDTFTANASVDKIINITVPTTAGEVSALPDSTKYGASIDLSLDTTNYKLTLTLKDQDGTTLNSKVVDFPIESVVVNGSYDAINQKIVLTLQNGNTIDIPVGALIAGLQTEITVNNKLDADLVDDNTSTNKFVTSSEKTSWNSKQDAIGDLSTIRSNATNGASAYTTIQGYGNIVTHNVSEFATSAQGTLADSAVQPADLATVATSGDYDDLINKPTIPAAQVNSDWNATSGVAQILNKPTIPVVPTNVSAFTNDAGYITSSALNGYATQNWVGQQGYITGITSSDVTTALGYTPYNASNPSGYITSSALAPYVLSSSLAMVATSGDYDDLINKPTIPAAQVNSDWNATSGVAQILNKPTIPVVPTNVSAFTNDAGYITSSALNGYATQNWVGQQGYITSSALTPYVLSSSLASVATSGSYDDLSNKPTIPTKTSDLTNDSGYITSSALTGYATESYVTTATANMQTTANLVTSISSASTDTQYPSAKCVYDIVGDIETLLAAI